MGKRVGDGVIRRDGCRMNKVIVATRPKAALYYETRRQPLFVKTTFLCANNVDVGMEKEIGVTGRIA